MAPRMMAASRLMGMRRGTSTVRRMTANTSDASTSRLDQSMTQASPLAVRAPRKRAYETPGNSPCTSVSAVPTVMMRKPQKMGRW
jgi:hypothetical protein